MQQLLLLLWLWLLLLFLNKANREFFGGGTQAGEFLLCGAVRCRRLNRYRWSSRWMSRTTRFLWALVGTKFWCSFDGGVFGCGRRQ
jgi:hypothetical protein